MPEQDVLGKIVDAVKRRLEATPAASDLAARARAAAAQRRDRDPRSLEESLDRRRPAVIAECKKASPSAGLLRRAFDPVTLARCYVRAGAAAISVVTEPDFFHGDPGWLRRVRAAVPVPVLRKDFILTPRQLEETAVLGADAVLLIRRLLDRDTLTRLLEVAAALDLEVLLEIFADEDPEPAVASGARLIGVNARDLATFEVRVDRVVELAGALPQDRIRVAESGIRGAEDLDRLQRAGYDAFLIGEHLVRAEDPAAALAALRAGPTRWRQTC